jgi:rubrerythrin
MKNDRDKKAMEKIIKEERSHLVTLAGHLSRSEG